jgi:hypothetical protein
MKLERGSYVESFQQSEVELSCSSCGSCLEGRYGAEKDDICRQVQMFSKNSEQIERLECAL